jgi:hypothetical protein
MYLSKYLPAQCHNGSQAGKRFSSDQKSNASHLSVVVFALTRFFVFLLMGLSALGNCGNIHSWSSVQSLPLFCFTEYVRIFTVSFYALFTFYSGSEAARIGRRPESKYHPSRWPVLCCCYRCYPAEVSPFTYHGWHNHSFGKRLGLTGQPSLPTQNKKIAEDGWPLALFLYDVVQNFAAWRSAPGYDMQKILSTLPRRLKDGLCFDVFAHPVFPSMV